MRLDFYWRDRDKEWALKQQAWWFPSREYMMQFFPALEKYPFLLVFCWIVRNWRFIRRICTNKCKKAGFRLRVRLLDIKEKLKGMIGRKKDGEEEMPEAAEGDKGSGADPNISGEDAAEEAAEKVEDIAEKAAGAAEKAVEKGEDFFEDETEKKAEASEVKEPKVETFIDDEDEENE